MDYMKLPRKLLRVEDLTFVLPDDFEGGLEDAIQLLLDYIRERMDNSERTDKSEEEKLATLLNSENNRRVAMNYGIFEMNDAGVYILK